MDIIHKYELGIPGERKAIELPLGSVPVHVEMQAGQPCLWVRQPVEALSKKPHHFLIVGTGKRFPRDANYVGTFQDGPYVWHLLETL